MMIAIELVPVAERESREANSRIRCDVNNWPSKMAETALSRGRSRRRFYPKRGMDGVGSAQSISLLVQF
jgi:hypothetical protein